MASGRELGRGRCSLCSARSAVMKRARRCPAGVPEPWPARMLERDELVEVGMAVSATETAEGLLARTDALVPLLRANALATEREGRIAAENIAALEQAGVFKMTAPKEAGGYELPVATQVDVLASVARG